MKKIFTIVSIVTLAFLIATALTKAYFKWNIHFNSVGVGSMGMCKEGLGGFSSYESLDGERLTFSRVRFPSETSAKECFESSLKKDVVSIQSREELFDKTGTAVVGQRIVATNYLDGPDSGFILSQDADSIVEIGSTSLRHALIFEKQWQKY